MSRRNGRTGSNGGPWVELPAKPPRVDDPYKYWADPPPDEYSDRCMYWVHAISQLGWRPNRRISGEGYDTSAHWYGIYLWEYLNVIFPLLQHIEAPKLAAAVAKQQIEQAQLDSHRALHRARRDPGHPVPREFLPAIDNALRDTGTVPSAMIDVAQDWIIITVPIPSIDGTPTAFHTMKLPRYADARYYVDATGTSNRLEYP